MAISKNTQNVRRSKSGHYNLGPRSYSSCPGTDPDLNNNLEDLTNFVLVATFASGYAGIAVTSGIEDADSRFFGSKSC